MKIYVASFNRASDNVLRPLVAAMKRRNIISGDYANATHIMAVGDRIETFDFVLERFRENRPIIHFWAGNISQGTHDEVYRHSMTLMSMMQLCESSKAKRRVIDLCRSVGKRPNAYVIGNPAMDDLSTDESAVPRKPYDLILYNPPTIRPASAIRNEVNHIKKLALKGSVWIEPNGDANSDLIPFNTPTAPRDVFLGLMKNCRKFFTNSSCMYYEAPFFLKPGQIVKIGERNTRREHGNVRLGNAAKRTIRALEDNL